MKWLLTDHLGSTTITASYDGQTREGELRYAAWGETRYTYGTTPTERRYTGQYEEAEIGLYFYGARYFDPSLGRFIQADTLIPGAGNVQAWDRYAAMLNNPINYIDPSGFTSACAHSNADPECNPDYKEAWIPLPIFIILPIDDNQIQSIQWFGGTDFAYQYGISWGYDDYCQGYHCGIDFSADWGTPVMAGVSGIVVNTWTIDNPSKFMGPFRVDIKVGNYRIIYGHLDGNILVEPGDLVEPSTIIGGVGNPSGKANSGNNHLHLEIRYPYSISGWQEKYISNPLTYMNSAFVQTLVDISLIQDDRSTVTLINGPGILDQPIIVRGGAGLW